jgi:hypothetical protein
VAYRALILDSTPPLVYYQGSRPYGDIARPRLAEFPAVRQALRISGGEAGNASVALNNADGLLTGELSSLPFLTPARLVEDGVEVFAGLVTGLEIGARARVDLEEGGEHRYTGLAPLRTTAALGDFAETRTLPQVYGRVTLEPVPMNTSGTAWVLADHAVQGVDSVSVSGAPFGAWSFANERDPVGRPIAVLRTTAGLADTPPRVSLRGKPDAATGALLERPDLVLYDWLVEVCGMDLERADFDALRSEAQGIVLAAVIEDSTATIQTLTDQLCQGAGMAWAPTAEGVAMLWPVEPVAPVLADRVLRLAHDPGLTASASHEGLCTVLELAYAYDWAAKDYTRVMVLRAPAMAGEIGEVRVRVEAPHLRTALNAEALGIRYLQYYSRPVWRVRGSRPRTDTRPGESVEISHPSSPILRGIVTSIVRRQIEEDLEIEAPLGDIPDVVLVSSSGTA